MIECRLHMVLGLSIEMDLEKVKVDPNDTRYDTTRVARVPSDVADPSDAERHGVPSSRARPTRMGRLGPRDRLTDGNSNSVQPGRYFIHRPA
jgi:hypothetical protein